jgi:diaminohydroxyphosphoribosylaminopyrimidine deaminase/5-amino-6-(5-phosphoribosylamino)uracil reductase
MSIRDFSATDHLHMAQALRLAEHGLYTCDPNPRVGCVVAHGERVIGSGAHLRAGEPHAEVHALREAGDAARGATAYVTLEPCAHHGRTPPCADALIAAGVARVVAACEDPYPKVAGAGLSRLRAAGVSVDAGLMAEAARELNRGFFARIERGRPWLRLKLAATLDGRTALRDGRSHWITGPAARADNMRWRARCSALLVGSGTALADDPKLTVRFEQPVAFKPPLRVVLDRLLRLPANAALLDGSSATLVVHDSTVAANDVRFAKVECLGVPARDQRLDLQVLMQALSERGVNELQVEAGPILSGALLQAGLVDEMLLYLDPSVLGDTARGMFALPEFAQLSDRPRWRIIDNRLVGEAVRLLLRPVSI